MVLRVPSCSRQVLLVVFLCLFSCNTFAQLSVPLATPEVLPVLAPKFQKELGKALEALRDNKPGEARHHLDVVSKFAPGNTDLNFLFGIYSAETNDWIQAKSYWQNVLAADPNHLNALLALSEAFLRENTPGDAIPYLEQAIEAEPSSWRAHAALAAVQLRRGLLDDSIKEARRAIDLGHSRADRVQPVLAQALHLRGEQAQAQQVLEMYLKGHPSDSASARQLATMQAGFREAVVPSPAMQPPAFAQSSLTPADLLSSNWLPADIDERVPPTQPGTSCNLEEVLEKSGKRIEELVANLDKFTATEVVSHQSVDKWGFASHPVRLKFDYLVSINETRLNLFTVEEHRDSRDLSTSFPDGIETTGLPALVLIFHPKYTQNFTISCEGLAQSHESLAWQVYFRQRADRPNLIRTYQVGIHGPVYAVALKGRAWIAADTFQITRLETDLIDPLPQIRLVSDHATVEYGPVHFNSRNLDMWLPQNADLHYDWRGRRAHRRHSFKNYFLFSVDDAQQISVPKASPPAN